MDWSTLVSFCSDAGFESEEAIKSFMIVLLAYVASHDDDDGWFLLCVLSFGLLLRLGIPGRCDHFVTDNIFLGSFGFRVVFMVKHLNNFISHFD